MSWHGVDLDGTIAQFPRWEGFDPMRIGPPIPRMVARVKDWLAKGEEVRIFTARACDGDPRVIENIEKWCEEHVGQKLVVTCRKDYDMIDLWDDRAVQVVRNTGIALDRPTAITDIEKTAACHEMNRTEFCDSFGDNCTNCPFGGGDPGEAE